MRRRLELTKFVDTLILQLGYILHSVRTWKKVFKLRIIVFVEYESEVEDERRRVKALLEKLRIDAEVLVFWLASGGLKTYESIIQGSCDDVAAENQVNDCLKNEEWWEDLQRVRGLTPSMTTSQDLAALADKLDSTQGRSHGAEEISSRRRQSVVNSAALPKRPTVSAISRLGVNIGIHTQNLAFDEQLDSDTDVGGAVAESDDSSSTADSDFSDAESVASEGDIAAGTAGPRDVERAPLLLHRSLRRKSHGDLLQRPMASASGRRATLARRLKSAPRRDGVGAAAGPSSASPSPAARGLGGGGGAASSSRSAVATGHTSPAGSFSHYGTLATSGSSLVLPSRRSGTASTRTLSPDKAADGGRRPSGFGGGGGGYAPNMTGSRSYLRSLRPAITRTQSGPFSSRVVPETVTTDEPSGSSRIMFAEPDPAAISRKSSAFLDADSSASYSAAALPPSRKASSAVALNGGGGTGTNSGGGGGGEYDKRPSSSSDTRINIPDLLEASYSADAKSPRSDDDSGSTYSTQSMALSFNDLPSRAQHLILNELMRQNSADTAVILTTLPIPVEGTCMSEEASVRYLSDVEVLCNELPPVLLVLSNHMTVTVSL